MKVEDKITIWFLLIVLGVLLLLGVLGTVDVIIQSTVSVKGSAKVVNINKLKENDYLISYSYYNEFRGRKYLLKKIIDRKAFDKIREQENIEIEYVSYFPKSPRLVDIESRSSIFLLVLGLAIVSLSFYRILLAAIGKITLSQFLGVNKDVHQTSPKL